MTGIRIGPRQLDLPPAAVLALRKKRSRCAASAVVRTGSTFSATRFSSRRWTASYTIPIPPRPISPRTRYLPAMVVPSASPWADVARVLVSEGFPWGPESSGVAQLAQNRDASGLSVQHVGHFKL